MITRWFSSITERALNVHGFHLQGYGVTGAKIHAKRKNCRDGWKGNDEKERKIPYRQSRIMRDLLRAISKSEVLFYHRCKYMSVEENLVPYERETLRRPVQNREDALKKTCYEWRRTTKECLLCGQKKTLKKTYRQG